MYSSFLVVVVHVYIASHFLSICVPCDYILHVHVSLPVLVWVL